MGEIRNPLRYRLGLDVGTGSLGWAVVEIDDDDQPVRVERLGSRIFSTGRKPKDNSSLAADRRQARSARRRRDRYIQRRKHLLNELTDAGLFPTEPSARGKLKNLHPFKLRHEALRRELTPHEIGRALYHLQQRRGFKSNRKADRGASDTGAMKTAIRNLDATIPDGETVGSYLWGEIQAGRGARARHRTEGSKNVYDFYIGREMVEEEFDAIWDKQREYHPELLTDGVRGHIHYAIFHQRPLKPVDPGKCFLEPDKKRAPDALVSSQLFRLFQEVNALRVTSEDDETLSERPLTRDERDKAASFLRAQKVCTFSKLKTHLFGRGAKLSFTHERGERSKIKGDLVSAELSGEPAFGSAWHALSLDEQDEVAQRIDDIEGPESEAELAQWLIATHGLKESTANYVATQVPLPDGHRRLSTVAIRKILPHLMDGWDEENDHALTYDQAVRAAGYRSHSENHSGELFERLPYYGQILTRYTQDLANRDSDHVKLTANPGEWEYGRIANPTVHIGLNQIRTVVNALIEEYGLPAQVHVELARDLGQSEERRREVYRKRSEGEKKNAELAAKLTSDFGVVNNYPNRVRLRLWEELGSLNHVCVLCGQKINRPRLFTNDYQVDHILPFQRTLDDSYANKMLVCFRCNQRKRDRSPYEAFAEQDEWDAIVARAKAAFGSNSRKFSRFGENAMERYEDGNRDFIARQLNDTRYLARVTKEYLGSIVDPNKVVTSPGFLTGLLRAKWGLNSLLGDGNQKDRTDHRHHAIDAAVVALTDRSTLKRVTDANRRAIELRRTDGNGDQKLLAAFEQPWPEFLGEMVHKVAGITVSHRPDHGVGGQLHEDTAYGVLEGPDKEGRYKTRKRVNDLDSGASTWEDSKWRPVVPIFRQGESPDSALPYKAYIGGSNYCIEIFRLSSGKWSGEVISTFEANQPEYRSFMEDRDRFLRESFKGHRLVMRLVADDTIAIEGPDGQRKIMRLCKIDSSGPMYFAEVQEGNVDARNRDSGSDFRMLKKSPAPLAKLEARRVFVDPIGNILDPGFNP